MRGIPGIREYVKRCIWHFFTNCADVRYVCGVLHIQGIQEAI
ncbi:hypothetical protein APHMUC_1621 [Anaplasma phagocytophilum str. ApMUC09]|uniref:Uncharacterized protein n=1 Tax=Anaplasma phagocytophilum str. ApMUC09 TaxID=1359152 RepID=A0A0F3NB72_ANAPH|nr:hypothetical protein APHMUC_1621 [Anaplasma phagocytophilum str. ApMUC09]